MIFKQELEVVYGDGRTWKVVNEFDVYLGPGITDYTIKVPAGFETDFASVPRILWNILPPTDKWGKAAVVHDYIYRSGGRLDEKVSISRFWADYIFLAGMHTLGVPWWKRYAMFVAVRLFGWRSFRKTITTTQVDHSETKTVVEITKTSDTTTTTTTGGLP